MPHRDGPIYDLSHGALSEGFKNPYFAYLAHHHKLYSCLLNLKFCYNNSTNSKLFA